MDLRKKYWTMYSISDNVKNGEKMIQQEEIIRILCLKYGLGIHTITLCRDWIGQVYIITAKDSRYVLKLYKKKTVEEILPSIEVVNYFYHQGFSVPRVIDTLGGELYTIIDGSVAVLSEYIEGLEVDRDSSLQQIGVLAGQMRHLMQDYQGDLTKQDASFFVQRYLDILHAKNYRHVEEFKSMGEELWKNVSRMQSGFMHGDFHTGNLFLKKGTLVVYDFDTCGLGYPAYDISTMCDATDYFTVGSDNFLTEREQITKNLDAFLIGYTQYSSITDVELGTISSFIALRHFDIQATIITTLGLECVDEAFLDQQLKWLYAWSDNTR